MNCPTCPHPSPSCPGLHTPRLCALARDRRDYRAHVALLAGAGRGGVLAPLDPWQFVSTSRLVEDTTALLPHLPPTVDAVVGVSRSGLLPASLLAYHLHLPLLTVSRQAGVLDPGHGHRMDGAGRPAPHHVLVVDDTVSHGREMRGVVPIVRAAFPGVELTRCVVYAHHVGAAEVDLWARDDPGPIFWEWNWVQSGHSANAAFDLDGILCRDFTREEDDGGDRYRETMARIEPRHLPRRAPIKLLVTARPESTRAITEAWLDRHRVKVERLVMRDWELDPSRDREQQVGAWKARVFAEHPGLGMFVESSPAQAAEIARLSGRTAICPPTMQVWAPTLDLHRRMTRCTHRRDTPECGCRGAGCRLDPAAERVVQAADCYACPHLPPP